jgi:2-keto-4-pentenoate hydratase/2-oxohepta-3-ene-1,7-dioic acid hydratase in catechol pathway
MALQPGDIIISGTPAGVGMARKPPLYMKAGDICEIEVDQIGLLSNRIVAE